LDLYEKIKALAAQKHISIRQLEEKVGIANGTIRQWGRKNPGVNNVKLVADFFHVTVDYLLGSEEKPSLKEPIDLADLVDENKVDWDEWVSFDGKPLTDEVKTALKLILGKRLED
jgi:transcriptional regulator with XRE-family HTH domain